MPIEAAIEKPIEAVIEKPIEAAIEKPQLTCFDLAPTKRH